MATPNENPEDPKGGAERIAKVIARSGLCSRREAEALIEERRVSVNGALIESAALDILPSDKVLVDGKPLAAPEPPRLWRYHKPKGRVTTHKDPEGRPTVFEALPENLPRLISVGRLDFNTEGLLLLTNDGDLARHLELPSTGWTRRYRVRAFGQVSEAQLEALADGVTINKMDYGPVEASLEREQGDNVWITVSIREGKNREVRRIMEHLGLTVNRLIRISFGPFMLGELEAGQIEEVKTAVLKDQLGPRLSRQLGVRREPMREERRLLPARGKPTYLRRKPDSARPRLAQTAEPQTGALKRRRILQEGEAGQATFEFVPEKPRKGRFAGEGDRTGKTPFRGREGEREDGRREPRFRSRGEEAGERGERPSFQRREEGQEGERKPRFQRRGEEAGERRERPPFRRREEGQEGEHQPRFQGRGEEAGERRERPSFRRREEGHEGERKPRFQSRGEEAGERRERPSFRRREEGQEGERKPRFQSRGEQAGERRERPSFRRREEGQEGERKPRFPRREEAGERRERPPFRRRDEGQEGERKPRFQSRGEEGGERRERPPFHRRDEGQEGERKPRFQSRGEQAGERRERPPFRRRDEGQEGERKPRFQSRGEEAGERRETPPFRRREEGQEGERRPRFQKRGEEAGKRAERPRFRDREGAREGAGAPPFEKGPRGGGFKGRSAAHEERRAGGARPERGGWKPRVDGDAKEQRDAKAGEARPFKKFRSGVHSEGQRPPRRFEASGGGAEGRERRPERPHGQKSRPKPFKSRADGERPPAGGARGGARLEGGKGKPFGGAGKGRPERRGAGPRKPGPRKEPQ